MAEDDGWEGREGRWTRRSESSEGGGGERYYELPDGEVVQGEPEGDVEAEPVEPPEEEEGGLSGLFGGDDGDDEPDEEDDDEDEEDDGSIVPIVAGIVVLLLVLLVLLVGAAYLGIADPLGIGDSLPGAGGGGDGGTDGGGGDGGDGGMNETPLFSYPVNWTTSNFTVDNHATGVAEKTGEANQTTFTLNRLNVTQATFTLTWTDDDGSNETNAEDTLELNVTSPGGQLKSSTQTARNGEIQITFEFASVPTTPTEIVADSRSNATGKLLEEQPVRTNGTGDYNITVRFVSGGDTCASTTDPITGELQDCSEDWTLDVSYTWYEGILGEGVRVES